MAKASISTNVTEPKEILSGGMELDEIQTFLRNLSPKLDQDSTKNSKSDNTKENEKISSLCSVKEDSIKSQIIGEEIILPIIDQMSQLFTPDQINMSLLTTSNPIDIMSQLRATEEVTPVITTLALDSEIETNSLRFNKEDSCSKPEKLRKTEINTKVASTSKPETILNKKILSFKGPIIEKPIKTKCTENKNGKLEMAFEKPKSDIDRVQDVVKVINVNYVNCALLWMLARYIFLKHVFIYLAC